jgi:ATP-dependent DNA helicase RecG
VCLLIADPATDEAEERLAAMAATTDGYVLAHEDLRIRGQGTVFGERQSGMADLKLADIFKDIELLSAARRDAFSIVAHDPGLEEHPDLADEVRALLGDSVEWLFKS